MSTTILLIRHGQTEWNKVERFRGHADIPLNHTGLHQAEITARRVATEWKPVAIYSSPLSRAVQTADAIGQKCGVINGTYPGLIDIEYGEWQGLTPDEVRKKWPGLFEQWHDTPQLVQIPKGETLEELHTRAMNTVQDLSTRHSGKTIVLVGHTVINRVILLGVLGLGLDRFWHIGQDPCAINCFDYEGNNTTLLSLNDTGHLFNLDPDQDS